MESQDRGGLGAHLHLRPSLSRSQTQDSKPRGSRRTWAQMDAGAIWVELAPSTEPGPGWRSRGVRSVKGGWAMYGVPDLFAPLHPSGNPPTPSDDSKAGPGWEARRGPRGAEPSRLAPGLQCLQAKLHGSPRFLFCLFPLLLLNLENPRAAARLGAEQSEGDPGYQHAPVPSRTFHRGVPRLCPCAFGALQVPRFLSLLCVSPNARAPARASPAIHRAPPRPTSPAAPLPAPAPTAPPACASRRPRAAPRPASPAWSRGWWARETGEPQPAEGAHPRASALAQRPAFPRPLPPPSLRLGCQGDGGDPIGVGAGSPTCPRVPPRAHCGASWRRSPRPPARTHAQAQRRRGFPTPPAPGKPWPRAGAVHERARQERLNTRVPGQDSPLAVRRRARGPGFLPSSSPPCTAHPGPPAPRVQGPPSRISPNAPLHLVTGPTPSLA